MATSWVEFVPIRGSADYGCEVRLTAEIIAVGNELLVGDVLDTNSHWLCARLTRLGALVRQVSQIRDQVEAVEGAVRAALGRGAGLVITVGGLGPTEDDVTLAGVARALNLKLQLDAEAFGLVSAKYVDLARLGHVKSAVMTPSREKMARLPFGATPLANEVGAAPGVLLRWNESVVVSLPGVPNELKGIFEGSLRPVLEEVLGEGLFLQWKATVDCGDESVLAPLLLSVSHAHSGVRIKSRPKRFGADVRFDLTLSARGGARASLDGLLRTTWVDLAQVLAEEGIDVISMEEVR